MSRLVIRELDHFTRTEASFRVAHQGCDPGLLGRFLGATMDEARLRFADGYAAQVLEKYDVEDWVHFRQGVHRREVAGEVAYDGQRDHSAHTLNNYLIGAYFWHHAPGLRASLVDHMNRRGIEASGGPEDSVRFFNLWVMTSLLHDIGYLFEGAAMPGTTRHSSALSAIGADVVREYFNSRFWVASGVTAPSERRALLDLSGVHPFDLEGDGFSAILEALRDVGDLSELRAAINRQVRTSDRMAGAAAVNVPPIHDAFEAWREHYTAFGATGMVDRIRELERYVHSCIYAGLGSSGLRMLDHGACSGLLMLRASTYFYSIMYGMRQPDGRLRAPSDANLRSAQERFDHANSLRGPTSVEYTPDWWWRAVCWATAATALHNHLQMEDPARESPLLKASDDPLTYLGVLVDIVEEWDRFRVRPNALGKSAPLQGVDVRLGNSGGVVTVSYPSSVAEQVRKQLAKTLDGWDQYLKIISRR